MKSIPQWFVHFCQFRTYRKTQEEPYILLFFLSKYYRATLHYTLNEELKPSSYLATFANKAILFRYTNYPSDGFVVSVDIATCSVTYLLQVIDGVLIEDDSFQCMESNCIVDLTFRGERWEGQTLDGRPFGWGELFDSDNRLVYQGFMFGSARICYGTSYYRDLPTEVIRYQGNYGWNEALGYGTRFDLCGNVVFEGEWVANHPVLSRSVCLECGSSFMEIPIPFFGEGSASCRGDSCQDTCRDDSCLDPSVEDSISDLDSTCGSEDRLSCVEDMPPFLEDPAASSINPLLTSHTEELVIGDRCCNDVRFQSLDLSFLLNLRSFSVGKESFLLTKSFTVRGLPHLCTISIGRRSFVNSADPLHDSTFCVANCPQLQRIEIGPGCFSSYRRCELHELPSLKTLGIGSGDAWAYCFKYCQEFHLVHFPRLQHVAIGGHSFPSVRSIRFESKLGEKW